MTSVTFVKLTVEEELKLPFPKRSHPVVGVQAGLELLIQMFVKVLFPSPRDIPVPFVPSMMILSKVRLLLVVLRMIPVPAKDWMVMSLKVSFVSLSVVMPVALVVLIRRVLNLLF